MTNEEKVIRYDKLNKSIRKLLKATTNVSDADKLLALDGFKILLIEDDMFIDVLKKDKRDIIQLSLKKKS